MPVRLVSVYRVPEGSSSPPVPTPAMPSHVRATPLTTSAIVSWSPSDDHDALGLSYLVEASTGQTATLSGPFDDIEMCTVVVTGLSALTPVTFTVKAVLGGQQSLASLPSASVTTAVPVTINAGSAIQTAINAQAAGKTFIIASGTHNNQSVTPRANDQIVLADGCIMDGGGVTAYAFVCAQTNITIRNAGGTVRPIVRNYTPATDPQAAVGHHGVGATFLLIDGIEITSISGGASARSSTDGIIRNCNIHANPGKVGITNYQGDRARIENNIISDNNSASTYDRYWDASGTKVVDCEDMVHRWNRVDNNDGPGIWYDLNCLRGIIQHNIVYSNAVSGIFFEVSRTVDISWNISYDNGATEGTGFVWHAANIQISASPYAHVHHNITWGVCAQIVAIQNDTHGARGDFGGDEVVHDLLVEYNTIGTPEHPVGNATGLGAFSINEALGDGDAASYYTSKNNVFDHNTYCGTTIHKFSVASTNLTKAQFQALGQETWGTWVEPQTYFETFTDPDGTVWNTTRWVKSFTGTGSTLTVEGNEGKMLTGATGGYTDSAQGLFNVTMPNNQVFSFQYRAAAATEAFLRVICRRADAFNMYFLELRPASNTAQWVKWVAGVPTDLGGGYTATPSQQTGVQVDIDVSGQVPKAWVYAIGGTKPTNPTHTISAASDSSHSAGGAGFMWLAGNAAAARTAYIDNVDLVGV